MKRPHSPTPQNLDSSKRLRGTKCIVVLGSLSDGKRIELDGDPTTITPHDVYKALLKADLVSSNSYDLCQLRCEMEGKEQILVAEVKEAEKDRSTKRKDHLSSIIDRCNLMLKVILKDETRELKACERGLIKARELREVYTHEVFVNLLRALNEIIFNPNPTPDQLLWRGNQVLQPDDIKWLKKKKKGYISEILEWQPDNPPNKAFKEKILDCLTAQQKVLANVLNSQDIKDLARTRNLNLSQHPCPSKYFAKVAVHKAFQDLELNIKHSGLEIADFENLIDHATTLLSQTDKRPLFEDEEEEEVSPRSLEERIAELKESIKKMEQESQKTVSSSYY